jgi:hypothetical protein
LAPDRVAAEQVVPGLLLLVTLPIAALLVAPWMPGWLFMCAMACARGLQVAHLLRGANA